jgi:hypothetical protein
MSDWIVDRRPLLADSDKNEQVLAWVHDNEYKDHPRWVFRHYTNVEVGQPWLPTPEPYTIDTSLAASIERVKKNCIQTLDIGSDSILIDDLDRILEAVKKVLTKSKGEDE